MFQTKSLEIGADKSNHTLVPDVFVQRRESAAFASEQLLPVPEPALVFPSTVPIMLRHFAGGTLHPALVFSQCDHSGGGQEVTLVQVQSEKPQRKEQSVFKLQGRERSADLYSWKRSAGHLFLCVGKELKN